MSTETDRRQSVDEREAIRLLQQGSIEGLEALVERYQLRALRTAALVTGSRSTAEDVVQQAFLRVYERAHQFDPGRPFAPWFLKIVVNDAAKAVRDRRRFLSLDNPWRDADVSMEDLVPDTALSPEEQAEQAETQATVWNAIAQLSPAQRAAVVRRYYLGLTDAENALASGQNVGAIKQLLHRARRRLGLLLSNE